MEKIAGASFYALWALLILTIGKLFIYGYDIISGTSLLSLLVPVAGLLSQNISMKAGNRLAANLVAIALCTFFFIRMALPPCTINTEQLATFKNNITNTKNRYETVAKDSLSQQDSVIIYHYLQQAYENTAKEQLRSITLSRSCQQCYEDSLATLTKQLAKDFFDQQNTPFCLCKDINATIEEKSRERLDKLIVDYPIDRKTRLARYYEKENNTLDMGTCVGVLKGIIQGGADTSFKPQKIIALETDRTTGIITTILFINKYN